MTAVGQVNALGAWGTATGRGAAGVAQPGPSPCVHPRSPRGRNSPTKLTLGRLCHGFDPADLEEKTAPSKEAWPRAAILWEQTPRCSKAPRANPNTPETTQEGWKPQQRGPESPGGGTKQIRVLGGGGAATRHSFYPPLLPTSSSTGKESRSSPSEASGLWAGAAPAGPCIARGKQL